jgi:hypothetical protein
MATNDDCTSLDAGDIRFYDNYVPKLAVGDYLINVTQRVNPKNTTPPIDDCYAASQLFSVQGPRYTLPPNDIFSIYPPANSQGVFDQFLPNIVLTQRALPWERNVFRDTDPMQQTPWLALLLFVAGEQIGGQDALTLPSGQHASSDLTMSATIPVDDLYIHKNEAGVLWPKLTAEWYETRDYRTRTLCSIIDVSAQAFTTLMPKKPDLRYLAHVRQVDSTSKDSQVLRITGDGWYSVVVGNRLPDAPAGPNSPGKLNIVHLVSLEGFEDYLTDTPLPEGTTRVRMISLKSWTFKCLAESGESFGVLMNGLLNDAKGNLKSTSFTLPSNEPADNSDATQYAYQAIQNGYLPLSYQTRLGEETFAWYRGPFSPVPVKNFINTEQQSAISPPEWKAFDRASDAIVYDKNYGLFDVSYGVAWETGRLLALSNAHFRNDLLDWQRKGHNLIDLILERQAQLPLSARLDPNDPDTSKQKVLVDLIEAYALSDDFIVNLVRQFTAQIGASAPPGPTEMTFTAMPPPVANPQTLQDLLTEWDVREQLGSVGGRELKRISEWLAQLYLLHDVPFENLVPNAGLLPPESIRFFYLDTNWLDLLVEGALSIGIESSRDRVYQALMKDFIWNTTFAALEQVRENLLGVPAEEQVPGSTRRFAQGSLSGMVLRSSVVSGWPGIQIHGFAKTLADPGDPDTSTEIQLLRMERLSNDVMLCLWPLVPVIVTVEEPHEGVAFGFDDYCLYLRSLDPQSYGMPMSGDKYEIDAQTKLIDSNRVIKIMASNGLVDTIRDTLPNSPVVNVRDFAVQMIKVPERAVFAAQSLAPSQE